MTNTRRFLTDRRAATAIEYCLIAGSIALLIVVGVAAIGSRLNTYFLQIAAVH